jgi:hypothetical protein
MRETDETQPSFQFADHLPAFGLFIEFGHQSRSEIKMLTRGTGPLAHQIKSSLHRWHDVLGLDNSTEVMPIVLLYSQRP